MRKSRIHYRSHPRRKKRIFGLTLLSILVVAVIGLIFIRVTSKKANALYTNMSASVVIGQQNFTDVQANQGGVVSERTFQSPIGIDTDGTRLFVADSNNNRVLIYNQIPSSNNVPADMVIGQPNFSDNQPNQGGSANGNTLFWPNDVLYVGGKLLISDSRNARVLIYNQIPSSPNASADVVIGQANKTATVPACSATGLEWPLGIDYDPVSGKLFIVDYQADRVMIYNQIPTSDGAPANTIIGSDDMNICYFGGSTAEYLYDPIDVKVIGGKVYIAQDVSSRVNVWNTIPTSNLAPADITIGQMDINNPDFLCTGTTDNLFCYAQGVATDGQRLFITDAYHNRIMVYNSIPTTSYPSASLVIGQPDFTHSDVNQGGTADANTLNIPAGPPLYVAGKLIIPDTANNRILIYDASALPWSISATANVPNLNPGTHIPFVVKTTMPYINTGQTEPSQVQARLPNGQVAMLGYAGMDGSLSVWTGSYDVPGGQTWNPNDVVIEAAAAGAQTTQVTNFTAPPTGSNNTGVNTTLSISYTPPPPQENHNPGPQGCNDRAPTKPPDLYQIITTRDSATLYMAPAGDPYTNYTISYGLGDGVYRNAVKFDQGHTGASIKYTVNSLSPNTTYYFKVAAGNGCTQGEWSKELKVKTDSYKNLGGLIFFAFNKTFRRISNLTRWW